MTLAENSALQKLIQRLVPTDRLLEIVRAEGVAGPWIVAPRGAVRPWEHHQGFALYAATVCIIGDNQWGWQTLTSSGSAPTREAAMAAADAAGRWLEVR